MMQHIEAENLDIYKIIMLVAETKKIEDSICEPFGIDKLTIEMINKFHMELIRKAAQRVIAGSAACAATINSSPIPFTDYSLLLIIGINMLSSITNIYNLNIKKEFILTFISCIAGFTSLFPITRHVVPPFIDGETGEIIIKALGSTYILVVDAILHRRINPNSITKEELQKFIKPLFMKELETEKKKTTPKS